MKPLLVLLIVFAAGCLTHYLLFEEINFSLCARISMTAMLIFTAIGHFVYTKGMVLMLPTFIPFKREVVLLTGIFEILIGFVLLIPTYKIYAGWVLIGFLILVLPANIHAAINKVDYQKASFNGYGIKYLWFRIPLQLFFIGWIYLSTIFSRT